MYFFKGKVVEKRPFYCSHDVVLFLWGYDVIQIPTVVFLINWLENKILAFAMEYYLALIVSRMVQKIFVAVFDSLSSEFVQQVQYICGVH